MTAFCGHDKNKNTVSCWEKNVKLKRLVHCLVHGHENGMAVAMYVINQRRVNKISEQALLNKLNPNGTTDNLHIEDFENLVDGLDVNLAVATHFAKKGGGIVVTLPTVAEGDMMLLDDFMAIAKEIGDISARFQQAFADGILTDREYDQVGAEIDEAIAALVRFKESVKLRVSK